MVFSESLALRVRHAVSKHHGVTEKRMFGGVGFLLNSHMFVGIWKDSLIVRLGAAAAEGGLAEPHAREFDVTGRPMRGWLMIEPDGIERESQLVGWLERAIEFVRLLPPKASKVRRKDRRR